MNLVKMCATKCFFSSFQARSITPSYGWVPSPTYKPHTSKGRLLGVFLYVSHLLTPAQQSLHHAKAYKSRSQSNTLCSLLTSRFLQQ